MSGSNKKLVTAALAAACILAACILAACAPAGDPASLDAPSDARSGEVRVTIPAVSPLLAAGRDAASRGISANAKAFLGRDRVEVLLIDSASNVVDSQTAFCDDLMWIADNISLFAPKGTGYTVRADIYNSLSSATTPMCRGTSAPFAIAVGTVSDVSVRCLPVSPTVLTLGDAVGPVELIPGTTAIESLVYKVGQEAWYSFIAGASVTQATMVPTVPSQPGFYLMAVNSSGSSIAGFDIGYYVAAGMPLRDEYSYTFGTTPGETYYLVLATFDYTMNGEVVLRGNGCTLAVENAP